MTESQVFGGGVAESVMSVQAAFVLLLAGALILLLPRRYVLVPILLSIFLVPQGNVIVLAGVHLFPLRIIAVFGLIRALRVKIWDREQLLSNGFNNIDWAFFCWTATRSLAVSLLWQTSGAVINQFGFVWSTLGAYLVLRCFVRKETDVRLVINVYVWIAVLNAIGMVYEKTHFQNLFALLIGGVRSVPSLRDGAIRSQGTFQHSILAGAFGATLFPLFVWLWKLRSRVTALIGLTASLIMAITSASSTSILAIGAAVIAICFWPCRRFMRQFRWGLAILLVVLHLSMKAPVWFLIARIDVIGASSGFHRANLIDTFIRHSSDWWLVGRKMTEDWGWDMWDLSNQFVAEGETGGLATFILFILIVSRSFGRIGTAVKRSVGFRNKEWYLWLIGCTIFAHVVSFFGVSYWDQTQVAWFTLLAIVSTVRVMPLPRPTHNSLPEVGGTESFEAIPANT